MHCWVFTPLSFAELCIELATIGLLDFVCDYAIETPRDESEFFVSMAVSESKSAAVDSWTAMKTALLASGTYQR